MATRGTVSARYDRFTKHEVAQPGASQMACFINFNRL